MNWNDIPEINESEKRNSIQFIVDTAMPKRENILSVFKSFLAIADIKTLFWGVEDSLILAFSMGFLLYFPIIFLTSAYKIMLEQVVFLTSPIIYIFLTLTILWKEELSNVIEWKFTLLTSFQEIMAMRMIVAGGISVLFIIPVDYFLWNNYFNEVSFIRILALSYSSLFLYGTISLLVERVLNFKVSFILPFIWILANYLSIKSPYMLQILESLPTYVFIIVSIISFVGFVINIKMYLFEKLEGGKSYAFN